MCKTIIFAVLYTIFVTNKVHATTITATGHSAVITKLYQEAKLSCTIPRAHPFTCQWNLEENAIVKNDDDHEIIISTNDNNCTLVIKSTKIEHLGTYTCTITYTDGSGVALGSAQLDSVAGVDYLGSSVSVVEGDSTELVCKPWGMPSPEVFWQMQNLETGVFTNIDKTDTRFTYSSIGDIDDAILHIANAQLSDRANYYCNATNSHGQGANFILLRVKSKLAPLWPAIGILVELFLLAVIIIIYELYKRKSKKTQNDEPKSK